LKSQNHLVIQNSGHSPTYALVTSPTVQRKSQMSTHMKNYVCI